MWYCTRYGQECRKLCEDELKMTMKQRSRKRQANDGNEKKERGANCKSIKELNEEERQQEQQQQQKKTMHGSGGGGGGNSKQQEQHPKQ